MLARRSFLEIVHEILQMEGRKKTHIMYGTGLTYPQAIRYLHMLKERELLITESDESGREVYKVTEKGRDALSHLDAVMSYFDRGNDNA